MLVQMYSTCNAAVLMSGCNCTLLDTQISLDIYFVQTFEVNALMCDIDCPCLCKTSYQKRFIIIISR